MSVPHRQLRPEARGSLGGRPRSCGLDLRGRFGACFVNGRSGLRPISQLTLSRQSATISLADQLYLLRIASCRGPHLHLQLYNKLIRSVLVLPRGQADSRPRRKEKPCCFVRLDIHLSLLFLEPFLLFARSQVAPNRRQIVFSKAKLDTLEPPHTRCACLDRLSSKIQNWSQSSVTFTPRP